MRGGSLKICTIRAGTYSLSGINEGGWTAGLYLTSSDNGETWQYHSRDGYDTAILDGGASSGSTGVNSGFWIDGGRDITINGLQFQHFTYYGIKVHGGDSDTCSTDFPFTVAAINGIVIENNIVHDIWSASLKVGGLTGGAGAITIHGQSLNALVSHNVVYNDTGMGIVAGANSSLGTACDNRKDNISGTTYQYNVVYNVNMANHDTGAVYMEDNNQKSSGLKVYRNYVWDYGTNSDHCIYLDDGTKGVTIQGNTCHGNGNSAPNDAQLFLNHGGYNNAWRGNIIDIQNLGAYIGVVQYSRCCSTNMRGNTFEGNLIIAGNSGGGGKGYTIYSNTPSWYYNPLIQHNDYFGYPQTPVSGGKLGGNGQKTGGCRPQCGDQAPQYKNPQIQTCPSGSINSWSYLLATNSPILGSPINFPAQTVNDNGTAWGQPGYWGPPGYVLPHSGTAPSYLRRKRC